MKKIDESNALLTRKEVMTVDKNANTKISWRSHRWQKKPSLGLRKEEDRLKLLKLGKLEEGTMEVGLTSQTMKESEKGLLT